MVSKVMAGTMFKKWEGGGELQTISGKWGGVISNLERVKGHERFGEGWGS